MTKKKRVRLRFWRKPYDSDVEDLEIAHLEAEIRHTMCGQPVEVKGRSPRRDNRSSPPNKSGFR